MLLKARYDIDLQSAALAAKPTHVKPEWGRINEQFEVSSKFVCHVGSDDGTGELLKHFKLAPSDAPGRHV